MYNASILPERQRDCIDSVFEAGMPFSLHIGFASNVQMFAQTVSLTVSLRKAFSICYMHTLMTHLTQAATFDLSTVISDSTPLLH